MESHKTPQKGKASSLEKEEQSWISNYTAKL